MDVAVVVVGVLLVLVGLAAARSAWGWRSHRVWAEERSRAGRFWLTGQTSVTGAWISMVFGRLMVSAGCLIVGVLFVIDGITQ